MREQNAEVGEEKRTFALLTLLFRINLLKESTLLQRINALVRAVCLVNFLNQLRRT